jgi:hypothetical protein
VVEARSIPALKIWTKLICQNPKIVSKKNVDAMENFRIGNLPAENRIINMQRKEEK